MALFMQNCSLNWSSVFCSFFFFFCSVLVQWFEDVRLFCLLMSVVEDFDRTCYF